MAAKIFLFAFVVLVKIVAYSAYPKDNNEWPEECAGQYYCFAITPAYKKLQPIFDKLLRDEVLGYEIGSETADRVSEENDVGHCRNEITPGKITMIKDKNQKIWFVPQSTNFSVVVNMKKCRNQAPMKPRRIIAKDRTGLMDDKLEKNNVNCVEQRVNFKFPVLSQDLRRIETARSPHLGLPMSCFAKILRKK